MISLFKRRLYPYKVYWIKLKRIQSKVKLELYCSKKGVKELTGTKLVKNLCHLNDQPDSHQINPVYEWIDLILETNFIIEY